MATTTLTEIRKKVRRLTRSPSANLLSEADLDQYINTFVLYDFPQHLRLYNLRSTFTFYTQPNVDVYSTETTDVNDTLYNFKNKILAVHPTVYIAGIPVMYTQWRDVFYGYYPQFNSIFNQVAVADGTIGPFTGTLSAIPILQNNVIFSTIAANNEALTVVDYPQNNATGLLGYPNTIPTVLSNFGSINYITGVFSVSFPSATTNGNPITAETIPYQAGKPYAILYYDQEFTVRPVPDKAYAVQLEVDIRPTELLDQNQSPDLEQWWQYIAYGAAKKVFEDRSDLDSVQLIMPEFTKQEQLVLRSTLTVQANERTQTIYTQGKNYGSGWGFGAGGWPY